jgi:hypothetical protein
MRVHPHRTTSAKDGCLMIGKEVQKEDAYDSLIGFIGRHFDADVREK